jgi:hypothetical protein
MQDVINHVLEAYPLLKRIAVKDTKKYDPPERLPPFLGLALAVMDNPPDTPICFVLPKRGDAGRLALILHTLLKLRQTHKVFLETLAHQKFRVGQTVCIHPSKEVFIYDGVRPEDPEHFWLAELDLARQKTGYRATFPMKMNFPLWAIQRLESTGAKRPKGDIRKRARELQAPPLAPIDALLETTTFGNLSCVKNAAILLDAQGDFADFASSVAMQLPPTYTGRKPLDGMIPFGWLAAPTTAQPGWVHRTDGEGLAGEPLITITHSAELLANYCIDAQTKSTLVVVNGLSRFRNNRQAYDDMAETQHIVLFADSSEGEMIEILGSAPRQCRFWWLTATEIQSGLNDQPATSTGRVGNIMRWAANCHQLKLEAESCEHPRLENACLLLEKLHAAIQLAPDGPLTRLASRAWRMLNDACTIIRPLAEDERQRAIQQAALLRQDLDRHTVWLSLEQKQLLMEATNAIESCFTPEAELGVAKGAALYRLLKTALDSGSKCALVARNEGQVADLRLWLCQNGFSTKAEAYSPRTLPEDAALDNLICISWLGGESMKHVAASLVAPTIKVVAYPFEGRWLQMSRKRLQQRPRAPRVTAAEKASLLRKGAETIVWPEEESPQPEPSQITGPDPEIWTFEQRLRAVRKGSAATPVFAADTIAARYVSFVGETYAFLTDNHSVVVATDLVSGRLRPNQRLPERVVTELKQGDFIVFPESGDREFILEKADQLLGAEAQRLRQLAHTWKDALWASRITPENFLKQAKDLKRSRHIVTIRSWFADTSQIGPGIGDEELTADLETIALVTNYAPLEKRLSDVAEAIKRLRGAHLSAGMRVRDTLLRRLPEVIGKVEENETKVDLEELGSAWVVELETVAAENEQRARGEVNRLLWEEAQILLFA